jgi:hypothetical protein
MARFLDDRARVEQRLGRRFAVLAAAGAADPARFSEQQVAAG